MKLLEPTARPPSIDEQPASIGAQTASLESEPSNARGSRRLIAGALALLGVVGLGATGIALLSSQESGHEHGAGDSEQTELRPVGKSLRSKIEGGRGGEVGLRINAEAPTGSESRLKAIPAGAPAQLSFSLPEGVSAKPGLVAHRIETSMSPDMMAPQPGHDDGQGAAGQSDGHKGKDHGGSSSKGGSSEGEGSVKYAETLALDRSETFLINRRSGEIVVPNAPGGAGGGHDHARDHGSSSPGQGLANTIPGYGFRAVLKIRPGAARVEVDPSRRFLVASYPEGGRLEVVDLLRRKTAGSVELDGRPGTLAFSPDGRLWVGDEDSERVAVVDVAARRVVREVPAGEGQKTLAFSSDRALVAAEDGSASLAEPRNLRPVRTLDLDGRPVAAAYAQQANVFAVADETGTLTLVSPSGTPRTIALGTQTGTRGLAISPDGRRAVTANARAGTLSIVDLERRRLVRTVEAGRAPSDVVFLGRFAVARNAESPELTWVDSREPSRSNNVPLGKSPATALSLSADGRELLAPGPDDRTVFKLHEMMGRPMVMEQTANTTGANVVVASDGGLERTGPRTFEQRTLFERAGSYHLELRLPGGGKAEFEVPVAAQRTNEARVRPESPRLRARVGEEIAVRFRVDGAVPKDAQVLAFSTGQGMSQLRAPARAIRGGTYEARLTPPAPGSYRVELLSEQAELRARPGSGAVLEVRR